MLAAEKQFRQITLSNNMDHVADMEVELDASLEYEKNHNRKIYDQLR